MKKDFYKEVKLDPKHIRTLNRLKDHADFKAFLEVMDMIAQSRVWGLVESDLTDEEKLKELQNISGGNDLWEYVKNLMKKSEEYLKANQPKNDK